MLMYEAGIDCRRVEVGVIGDRKETTSFASCELFEDGAGIEYVKFVTDAS